MIIRPFAKKRFHLAGIIPANLKDTFGYLWHDCLMPVEDKITAIHAAALEATAAGATTIWVVCPHSSKPILRKTLGDWLAASFHNIQRPIYYISLPPLQMGERFKKYDLSWSILYGAWIAYEISVNMARWLVPGKYYISFPYSVSPINYIGINKKMFKSSINQFVTYDNKTIKDNEYLGISFGAKEWNMLYANYQNLVQAKETIPLDKLFSCLNFEDDGMVTLPWYFDISNWKNYKEYMKSNFNILQEYHEI